MFKMPLHLSEHQYKQKEIHHENAPLYAHLCRSTAARWL